MTGSRMQELQELLAPAIVEMCSSMLALDVAEEFGDVAPIASPTLVGCVHLAGATLGVVFIQCSIAFARRVAATMFDLALENLSDADIRDAVGELTNVAAGNLKGALPEPYLLSLPTVVEGDDFRTHLPNGRQVAHSDFTCGDDRFTVLVFEQDPTPRK